jgi:hypothetical protein
MPQRPRPDYTDAGPLPHVPTRDGHTAVIRRIGDPPAPESPAPRGCTDRTVTFAELVEAADPQPWHDDHWTDCVDLPVEDRPAPSLVGVRSDETPLYMRRLRLGVATALTHTARTDAAWFRYRQDDQSDFDRSLAAFQATFGTTKSMQTAFGKASPNTIVFTTVAPSVFDAPAGGAK